MSLINPKLLRITTVPVSLKTLIKGQHRFMAQNGFEVLGVSSVGKELQEVAQEENIRVVALEMTRTISPLNDLKSLWYFYKLCKRERPYIVHSHTPKAGIVGMLGAKLAGVPIRLHTVAGLPLMEAAGIKRRLLDFVEKLTYSCATKVYPNAAGLYDFIVAQNYTKKEKVKVIANGSSNGINTTYFSPEAIPAKEKENLKNQLHLQPADFVFIFVGRLVGDKGINELVQAFDKLQSADSNLQRQATSQAKLLVVGPFETDLDPLLPATLTAITNNPNIINVGFQADVRPYLAISNALVFPSYREGFPNVVMQAGAMGLPSVVTDINGCNEIIIDGENGLIIPVKDAIALEAAMEKLYVEKDLCVSMSAKARAMIVDRYEQKKVWELILAEYQTHLKDKGIN